MKAVRLLITLIAFVSAELEEGIQTLFFESKSCSKTLTKNMEH